LLNRHAELQVIDPNYIDIIVLVTVTTYLLAIVNAVLAIQSSRTPQGATAWSIALISLPFLALPLYWIFGRKKFHGYVEAHRRAEARVGRRVEQILEAIHDNAASAPEGLDSFFRLIGGQTRLPFTRGNSVELLVDGEQTFASMLEAIRDAKDYVLIQFYIYRADDIGTKIADALLERARNGVRIYFLYDEIGSSRLPKKFILRLTRNGVAVSGFKTTKGRGNRFQVNFRNHRKLLVVDGHFAFVGGLNVGDDYLGLYPEVGPWRDTHIRIQGPAVQVAQVSFVLDWFWSMEQIPDLNWRPRISDGNASVTVIHTGPADITTLATLYHVEAFNTARNRIWIANPYFVPDEPTAKALELAALRGVDVRIILPGNNDNRLVQFAAMTYIDQLQPSGVKFFFYRQGAKGFLHEKVFLVDDRLSAVGTTNLDNRSLHINFECAALVVDRDFAGSVEAMFLSDFADSTPMEHPVFDGKTYWHRLAAKTANLAAPML
jgi:cardiolipin synthase